MKTSNSFQQWLSFTSFPLVLFVEFVRPFISTSRRDRRTRATMVMPVVVRLACVTALLLLVAAARGGADGALAEGEKQPFGHSPPTANAKGEEEGEGDLLPRLEHNVHLDVPLIVTKQTYRLAGHDMIIHDPQQVPTSIRLIRKQH